MRIHAYFAACMHMLQHAYACIWCSMDARVYVSAQDAHTACDKYIHMHAATICIHMTCMLLHRYLGWLIEFQCLSNLFSKMRGQYMRGLYKRVLVAAVECLLQELHLHETPPTRDTQTHIRARARAHTHTHTQTHSARVCARAHTHSQTR